MHETTQRLKQKKEYKFFSRLRNHYEGKTGDDFILTKEEFEFLINKGEINYKNGILLGDGTYSTIINFNNSGFDLKNSFGISTVTYRIDKNEKNGFRAFYDKYDFDSKPWEVRSIEDIILFQLIKLLI